MNKICTSQEQSKKLIELGIDVNTADMFWDTLFAKKPEAQVDNHHFVDEYDDKYRVPAWSLSALMELMNRNYYNMSLNCHGAEWDVKFDDSETYKAFTKDYAVDAAFEMICWLLENKKL